MSERVYGAVRCNGEYYPVVALADLDGQPTFDLDLAEWLVFDLDGKSYSVENAEGILVPMQ